MADNPTSEETKPPSETPKPEAISGFEVLKLYLETAKWLLAITTGLLVFGMDRLETQAGSTMFLFFAAAAACLSASAAFNLFFLLQAFNFLSRRAKTGDPKGKGVERAHKLAGIAYQLTISAFILGVALYVPFQAVAIIKESLKSTPVTLEKGPADLLVARRGECIWALRTADAKPRWAPLPALDAHHCSDHP